MRFQRWYARRFLCPYWGCKPYGLHGWSPAYVGKFDKQASVRGTCENCGDVMPFKLEDIPDDVPVVWFGRGWDAGCTDNLKVEAPSGEFCHGCYDPMGPRSSGVAERDEDGRWIFYDPSCWGDVLNTRNAAETLEADEQYADRPAPKDW